MQLDGPDLEELLVRARQEYGSDVRIVQADKVRTGGLGGFFARERYQLSVEVDGQADPGAAEPGPASLLDLAEAISDRESSDRESSDRESSDRTPANESGDGFTPGIPPANPAGPTLSTDSESFADILARLTETAGTQRERPGASAQPSATVLPGAIVDATAHRRAEPAITRPRFAEPDRCAGRAVPAPRRPRSAPLAALSVQDLQRLGLPPALLVESPSGDLLATLVGALRTLPAAPQPPNGAGDIVAVVGDGETAWDAALNVARSIGLDERAMVYVTAGQAPTRVAPARRVTGIEQLATRLDRWRKRATPTVAVLDAPMSVKSAWWNRRALATLRPKAVWLVVPATRKTDDVAGWAHRLGRADALMVTDADSSTDPASVLRLGLPVAWLDGRPATPGSWAGLLVDRLVAAR